MRNTYLLISGLCAVVTVFLGVVQTFGLTSILGVGETAVATAVVAPPAERAPVNELTVAKLEPAAATEPVTGPLRFGRGTRDGVVDRYPISDLFDGNPLTFIETQPGDRDIDFIAEFASQRPMKIGGLEYRHAANAGEDTAPTQVDVIVLPEGDMSGAGRQVSSFTISPEKGPQRFTFPAAMGKGVWLRVAGEPDGGDLTIGDFRILATSEP